MVGKIAIAVLLLGGLVAGALIGGVVSGTQPALLGWLFGAGAGLKPPEAVDVEARPVSVTVGADGDGLRSQSRAGASGP